MDDDTSAIVDKIKEHASKAGEFQPSLEGKENELFKKIVLTTILLLHSDDPNSTICSDTDFYLRGLKYVRKLYCYIKYYEQYSTTSSYYGLIFYNILNELKEKCKYNDTTGCKKIEDPNEIILLEDKLWEKMGYVDDNNKKNSQNKKWLAVWFAFSNKMKSVKTDQEKLALQQLTFIEEFTAKFGKLEIDDSFFEQLHTILPNITKDNELETFLKERNFDFKKNTLAKYQNLSKRSENYLQSFIREFRENRIVKEFIEKNLYHSSSDLSLIAQVLDLLNIYKKRKDTIEREAADKKKIADEADEKKKREEEAAEKKRREEAEKEAA